MENYTNGNSLDAWNPQLFGRNRTIYMHLKQLAGGSYLLVNRERYGEQQYKSQRTGQFKRCSGAHRSTGSGAIIYCL